MEFVTSHPVPHRQAGPLVPGHQSSWLLSEAAGLTTSSSGELAITAFLFHGHLTTLFYHPSAGDRPKLKPRASHSPSRTSPAIHCRSMPPSFLLFGRLLHGTTAARPKDGPTPQVTTTSGRTATTTTSFGSKAIGSCVGRSATVMASFGSTAMAPRHRAWIWAQQA
jgi:hypothetical protein